MQPGGCLEGECHLACSDSMKSGTEPYEPVASHTVPLCGLCHRSRGLAQEGWPCVAQLVLPPLCKGQCWALMSFIHGPGGLHFH